MILSYSLFKTLKNQFLLFIIFILTCGFNPTDIFFKNLNLMPDPMDSADRYPHLPKEYKEAKSENIMPSLNLKFSQLNLDENLMNNTYSLRKLVPKTTISVDQIVDNIVPSAKGVSFASGGMGRLVKIDSIIDDDMLEINFLENETKKIPILNDINGMPYMYNNKTPVVTKIEDIRVPGLDDVLPTDVGSPLKPKDYDLQESFDFFDSILPDKVLNQKVTDIIP